jgi:hypothetical protein
LDGAASHGVRLRANTRTVAAFEGGSGCDQPLRRVGTKQGKNLDHGFFIAAEQKFFKGRWEFPRGDSVSTESKLKFHKGA